MVHLPVCGLVVRLVGFLMIDLFRIDRQPQQGAEQTSFALIAGQPLVDDLSGRQESFAVGHV